MSASVHAGKRPPGSRPPRADTPPPERRPLLRTVRILLECILVIKRTYLFCLIELFMNLNDHIFYIYLKIKNSIFICNYMLNIARVVRTSVRTASLKIRFRREFLQAKSDFRYNYSRKKSRSRRNFNVLLKYEIHDHEKVDKSSLIAMM